MATTKGKLTSREQRLTDRLITGLQALAEPERQAPKLSRSEPRGAIPSGRGYAESNYQPGTATSTGGLASPLTEGETADPISPADPLLDRTYYAPTQFVTSDGLFIMELEPIQTIKFRDANGDSAEFRIANPYAEEPAP